MRHFVRAATVIVTGCLTFTTANAAPFLPLPTAPAGNITLVQDAGPGMWHGYQGAREPKPGYKRGDDGWWYPLAAFAVGAMVGGAVASGGNQPPPPPPQGGEPPPPPPRANQGRYSPEHYAWCAKRYKTYRASDNSYVPRVGVRAQCHSPY